jgi:hypothetical protein
MAKKVEVEIDVKTEASVAKLRELRKQLKQTAAGSADFNKLSAEIRDVEDALDGAKLGAEDFQGALEAAPGPVGKLFSAIKKVEIATKSWGAALKATGIGLIVAAVGGLVAAFTQTEGAMKKLEPLLIGLEKILGGIFEAFQPVLDAFLEMALKALPYITDGIKIFYSSLFGLFTLVKEAGVGVGKILKGVFTLDVDSIKEGWDQLKGGWSKTVDAYNSTSERFKAGTKKLTKTQKENNKELADSDKKRLDDKIKNLEAEGKYEEALLAKKKAIDMEDEFSEEQKLYTNKKYADELYELQKAALEKKLALYQKDSVEYKALQTELTNLDANKITQTTEFNNQLEAIREKNAQAEIDFETKLAEDLQKIEDKKLEDKLKEAEEAAKFQLDQFNKIKELEQARVDQTFAANQAIAKSWVDLGGSIASTFGTLINVFEEGSDFAKAFGVAQVAISTATSIGSILLNNQQAQAEYNKAIAAGNATIALGISSAFIPGMQGISVAQLASGKAAVAAAVAGKAASKINSIAQISAAGVAGAAQIAAILSAKKSGAKTSGVTSVGGSGVSTATAPSFGGAPSMATPQIEAGQGMNPTQQIGETISKSQKPIEAYVVSQKISSQQALDRRTNVAATFG